MDESLQQRIENSPKYKELVQKKNRLLRPFLLVSLIPYYLFILLLAFRPDLLSIRTGEGVTTLGIVVGFVLILLTIGITGLYIHKTDTKVLNIAEDLKNTIGGA